MGNSFLNTLLSVFKSKITPLVTKIRYFLTPQFWRTKIISKFREVFSQIFNVRPKDKDDYYPFGRYLVSKRLAYAVVLVIGVLSLVYIVSIWGVLFPEGTGIKTYSYNSPLLRITNADKVIITGKGGYKAYEGAVKSGAVNGRGSLYDKHENLVYEGNFENNRYNGAGKEYYPDGTVKYSGNFVENFYEGEGSLFRNSGTLEYKGSFVHGMKDGTGELYDEGGNLVYTGAFSQDALLYFELIGKSASQIRESYVGDWTTYESSQDYCVHMPDIDAVYSGSSPEASVEDEVKVDTVYVLNNHFRKGGKDYSSIKELNELFGDPLYQGNSRAIMPEAVIISIMSGYKNVLSGPIDIDYNKSYNEYCEVRGFDGRYPLYLYSYESDGVLYTFFCASKDSDFDFYSMMSAGKGETGDTDTQGETN